MQNVKLNFGRLCQGMLQMLWCQAVPKRNWSSLQNIQFLELLVTSSLGSSLDLGSPWITAILGNSHCMLALPLHLLMPVVTLGYQICPLFWFITAFFFFCVCVLEYLFCFWARILKSKPLLLCDSTTFWCCIAHQQSSMPASVGGYYDPNQTAESSYFSRIKGSLHMKVP